MRLRLRWSVLATITIVSLACKTKSASTDAGTTASAPAAPTPTADDSLCAANCKEMGKCGAKTTNDPTIVGNRLENTKGFACVARSDAECRASDGCRLRGECMKVREECKPGSDADCLASANCKRYGNCTKDSVCAVTSAKDCAGKPCTAHGLCKFVSLGATFGRCEPSTDGDCKHSTGCASDGACAMIRNPGSKTVCGAASDADCRASTVCKSEGRCARGTAFDGFACVR